MSLPDEVRSARKAMPPGFIQGMAMRCLLALTVLATMAIAGYLVNGDKSRRFGGYESLISLAGEQRLLTANAALLAEHLTESRDPAQQRKLLTELTAVANDLQRNHRLILSGDSSRGVLPAPPSVETIFREPPYRLDDAMNGFVSEIQSAIGLGANGRLTTAEPLHMRQVISGPDGMLAALDEVGKTYRAESRDSLQRVRATERMILAATLFGIVLTGLGVFWPMIRQVNLETEKLESFNAILDQRNAELARTLAALQKEREERRSRMQSMATVLEDLEEERGKLQREIQARQLVQEALEASEQRFYAIIESAPTAMVMTDHHGEIVLANAETERLFGYEREEILGKPIEVLIPSQCGREHPMSGGKSNHYSQVRRMGGGRTLYAVRKDGREVPVEIGFNPIATEEGPFVLSAIVDITERKRSEEEIKRINKELQSKNHEMQQFVYTVSHDLKSPLVTCRGFVGLMKEDAAQGRWDDVLDSVSRIERATQRMGDLIEDLLQLSRIGVIRNEPENIDVGQMLEGIAEELAERLQQAGAKLEVQASLPEVHADRVRLAEVFENLISNAIKYGCRGGNGLIQIGGEKTDSEVLYYVKDNGPGIPKEFHQKVFGLFQRLDSNEEGTGVGLAAVARILEIHGGRVWVESEAGHGATFWIAFASKHESPLAGISDQPLSAFSETPVGT